MTDSAHAQDSKDTGDVLLYITDEELAEMVCAAVARFTYDESLHPRAADGKWTDGGGEMAYLLDKIAKGGVSYQPVLKSSPTSGYVVSSHEEWSKHLKADEPLTPDAIINYLEKHQAVFKSDMGAHFGVWLNQEDGSHWLDVSQVEQDLGKAIALGIKHNQVSIYDIANDKTIPTGGTGSATFAFRYPSRREPGRFAEALRQDQRHEGRDPRAQGRKEVAHCYPFHRKWGTLLTFNDWNEDDHPRGESGAGTNAGSFAPAGSGGSSIDTGYDPLGETQADPWNKDTSTRLESQYKAVKDAIEEIAQRVQGTSVGDVPDMDNAPLVPEEWDQVSEGWKAEAYASWENANWQSFYDSEMESWSDSSAPDAAKSLVAYQFATGENLEWATGTIAEWRDETGYDGPLTNAQIGDALKVTHESGDGQTTIEVDGIFDPVSADAAQLLMPGFEPGGQTLSQKEELISRLETAFNKEADWMLSHDKVEAPGYLAEQATEAMQEYWDNKDDSEKFDYVKDHTPVIEEAQAEFDAYAKGGVASWQVEAPKNYDPLQTGNDPMAYTKTQGMARALSLERAKDLLVSRGIFASEKDALAWANTVDAKLWTSWKDSSTNGGGWLLQVATSRELGGHLNNEHNSSLTESYAAQVANEFMKGVNEREDQGIKAVQALVRAKWETTQYMLEKAGIKDLWLYRGVNLGRTSEQGAALDEQLATESTTVVRSTSTYAGTITNKYVKLPGVDLKRNGAQSATVNPVVANTWSSSNSRVVVRMQVPRTAVLSVPAYGINITAEQEVVVAGTGWTKWDAWYKVAPTTEMVPL